MELDVRTHRFDHAYHCLFISTVNISWSHGDVGAAQEHAFHALAPSLARSSSHTRRRPEVEDEQ